MRRTGPSSDIEWKEWSEESFKEAREKGTLVLLDLTASWCHWCHVMDEKTYSNPEIALTINKHFVPIRVDIDRRPDISERYNRGGFPTTAFLSDHGESIWGATFIPPTDMKRIMEAILRAKESGEIDRALEKDRMSAFAIPVDLTAISAVGAVELPAIFEDIFSVYDVEFGGFGSDPKFPHPDVLDMLLMKYAETRDRQLADAVAHSLDKMASGLHDRVEGGVFRYSVTRDWQTPHYEKMLETNVGFLGNLAHAHGTIGSDGFDRLATEIADYLIERLQDPKSGGFFGSQDADEEYYKLDAKARKRRRAPSIDRTLYAGWNSEASATSTIAGSIFANEKMTRAGKAAFDYVLENLWSPRLGLVRHVASEELYLFEDQVSFMRALMAQLGSSSDDKTIGLIEGLIRGVQRSFMARRGGFNDVVTRGDEIGELGNPKRPLAANSHWALALAQFGSVTHTPKLVGEAREILQSFSKSEVEAYGVFGASYVMARWALEKGFSVVEIHVKKGTDIVRNGLLAAAWKVFDPSVVPITFVDQAQPEPYAVICSERGCSHKIANTSELLTLLDEVRRRD